jgi:hypothetical protein
MALDATHVYWSAGARLIWTNRVANGSVMSAPMR